MLAHEVFGNASQELIALNKKRSEELLLEIFETLSEGTIKFVDRADSDGAMRIANDFICSKSNVTELLFREKETV
jgi:hypothetical protein